MSRVSADFVARKIGSHFMERVKASAPARRGNPLPRRESPRRVEHGEHHLVEQLSRRCSRLVRISAGERHDVDIVSALGDFNADGRNLARCRFCPGIGRKNPHAEERLRLDLFQAESGLKRNSTIARDPNAVSVCGTAV